METYQTFYKGLINSSEISAESCSCADGVFDTINVNSLTASHIYGIICEVINTSILFPEIGFSFDPAVNTFSIYLYDDSIPLSRIRTSAYSSTATASTLVFRDATNSTTMYNLTVSGLLSATSNPLSVVSHSNEVYVQSDNGNQEFYLTGTPTSGTSNYYPLHADNSGNISFNANTHRLTIGFLRCTDTALSTMAGGLTVTGDITAINSGSVVTNSNAVLTYNTTTGTYYLPLVTTTGTGYKSLSANLSMNYNAATATLTTSIGSFTTSVVSATGTLATGFITSGTYTGGTIGLSTPSLYLGGVTGNKQGMIRFHSGTTAFTTYAGTDTSGNFYIDPTDGKNLNLCTKPVASSANLTIGASAIPSTITIYGNTNQTGIITGSTGNFLLGDWNTDTPSLSLGSTNGTNEGVLELISNATQSFLLESTPTGGFEIYLKTSGTSVALFQLNSTYYNIYTNINLNTGNMYKINNVDLNTDHIQESGTPTNLYFTNLRSRTAIVPTNTTEINHTYSTATGVLTSNINAISITNAMLAGSIANAKLTNSSISLNGQTMSLGSTYNLPNNSVVNNMLVNSSTTLGTTTLSLGGTTTGLSGMSSITFSSMSLATLKIVSGGITIPYNNVLFAKLGTGTKSTALIGTNWQRVENGSGSSILEVTFYPYSTSGTLKLEASLPTFYTATNTGTNFNIQVLKNSASTTTVAISTNMVHSLWFNRNITAANTTYIVPLLGTYSFTGGTVGDYYTISVYFQSLTSFANGSTIGRATDDIPTNLVVTQIA